MSLIQDALKRKAEETPEPPVPQEVHSVLHEPPAGTPEPAKEPKPLSIIVIVLLVLALLVALGGLAFSLIRAPRKPVAAEQPAPAAPQPATVTETPPAPVVSAIETPAESPPVPAAPPAMVVEIPAMPDVGTQAEPVVEPTVTETWPDLKLTGIASSGNQRIAIINGKMFTVGRRIGEVIVREVRETQAVVEFRGERRILHVDE